MRIASVGGEAAIEFRRRIEVRTEEIVQVCTEVCDVALGGDEREDVPVRVRAVLEVELVPAELEAGGDGVANSAHSAGTWVR